MKKISAKLGILFFCVLAIVLAWQISNTKQGFAVYRNDTIVVYPTFTGSAYEKGGFYDYYHNKCSTCTTIPTNESLPNQMSSSRNAFKIFKQLGYAMVNDQQLDKNPEILKKYKKVIVLHNEYVTQREFNAITTHSKVLYLYPNSLYAKVILNANNTITLSRGHGYPNGTKNGFDWRDDTTKYEMDRDCNNMKFINVSNGVALNCYPEYSMVAKIIWDEIQR